jgi:hypothetical protein
MRHARALFAAVLAAFAAACSATPTTPTFPDAPADAPVFNQGMMGSGQSVEVRGVALEP